jgi:hypothetical protein
LEKAEFEQKLGFLIGISVDPFDPLQFLKNIVQ